MFRAETLAGINPRADGLGCIVADERKYTREEVALVLREVAQQSLARTASEGLTRAELEAVVREVGLDPSELDGALARLESRTKNESRILGMRRHVVADRRVAAQLSPERLAQATKLINRSVGTIGRSEADEGGLSWFGRHVNVTVTRAGRQVAVQVEERFHNTVRGRLGLGAMVATMLALASLVGLANLGLEPLGLVLFPLFYLATYVGLRGLHANTVQETQSRLEGLADQLAELFAGDSAPKMLGD